MFLAYQFNFILEGVTIRSVSKIVEKAHHANRWTSLCRHSSKLQPIQRRHRLVTVFERPVAALAKIPDYRFHHLVRLFHYANDVMEPRVRRVHKYAIC
jgi:hypothetical protein